MSGGRLPPSNAFSVGQQQPYLNHDAGNHFQSSPSHGAFVQPEKKGIGHEAQFTARVNSQAQIVPQEMNPALRGEEISNDRLSYRNVTEAIFMFPFDSEMPVSGLVFVIPSLSDLFTLEDRNRILSNNGKSLKLISFDFLIYYGVIGF